MQAGRGEVIAGCAGAVVAFVMLLALAPAAPGATLVVEKTGDGGQRSLRGTIARADADDTVRVPRGEYRLREGQIPVEEGITIRGAGARRTVVDGRGRSRVFEITAGDPVKMAKLTVTGGRDDFGAGIWSQAPLALERMRINRNRAATGQAARAGAGVAAFEDLTLTRTRVARNVVVGGDGQNFAAGVFHVGDGGDLRIIGSTIAGNTITGDSGGGAGFFMSSIVSSGPPDLLVRRSTISGNSAPEFGGGFVYQLTDTDGFSTHVRITGSTISGNSASDSFQGFGGGAYVSSVLTTGAAQVDYLVTNSTLSGNTAGTPDARGWGGGIRLDSVSLNGSTTTSRLNNVTVAGNRAFVTTDGGGGGGIYTEFTGGGEPVLTNTIVARNRSVGDAGLRDCDGDIVSGGNNLEGATSCGFTALGDLQDTNPLLERLKANGGPTMTRALGRGSLALNRGSNATCEPRDQRGVARPQGPRCDIGAYERKR